MEIAPVILFVGILVFLSHWFAGLFSRIRIPDVMLLILVGVALGPVLRVVTPEDFGGVGPVFVTLALVIILFESGTGLRLDTLRSSMRKTAVLTVVSFAAMVGTVATASYLTSDLGVLRSVMLGAIVGGTASAVVIPLTAHLNLRNDSRTVLVIESALTDVLCIVFALAFLEAYRLGELRIGTMVGKTLSAFLLAGMFGMVGALTWSLLLHKIRTLQNSIFTTPAFVFIVYGVVEMLGYSGAIAALVFGIGIGNIEILNVPLVKQYLPRTPITLNSQERVVFAEAVFLMKTFFFVFVGLSIQLRDPWFIATGMLFTLVILATRFLVVRFVVERTTPAFDASIMAVMIPRGLAAAVLASLPLQQGVEGGEFIQNVTYAVVLFTILTNSILVFLIEKTPVGTLVARILGYRGTGLAPEESAVPPAQPVVTDEPAP